MSHTSCFICAGARRQFTISDNGDAGYECMKCGARTWELGLLLMPPNSNSNNISSKEQMMTIWEHKVERISIRFNGIDDNVDIIQAKLDEFGAQGWEIVQLDFVGVPEQPSTFGDMALVFKRPKVEVK